MPPTTTEDLEARALGLSAAGSDPANAVAELVAAGSRDRAALEVARDRVARRMHDNVGDTTAGAALALLNKALVEVGWVDPYQWKQRLGNRLRKP